MNLENDYTAITNYVLNESSDEEKANIEKRIKSDEEFAKLVKEVRLMTNINQKDKSNIDENLGWEKFSTKLQQRLSDVDNKSVRKTRVHYLDHRKNREKRSVTFLKYAALILLTIGVSYFLSGKFQTVGTASKTEYKVLAVHKSERKTIVLYDGTTIVLDSGSKLKYPKKFGKTREVFFEGEGFFQVAKNKKKPFIIHSRNAQIQVLGTKFNVSSWDEDTTGVVVTVAEGKVSLSNNETGKHEKVILTKNLQASLSHGGKLSSVATVESGKYFKWMHNEKYFEKATFKQIVLQLERWYGLEFIVDEELWGKKNLTVHLNGNNINELLDLISVVTNTKIERQGKKIHITKL